MKSLPLSLACASAALLAFSTVSRAADETVAPGNGIAAATGAKLTDTDAAFVKKAAGGGLAEVKLGELTKTNAANAEVKAFGEKMVTDHSKANEDLKSVADAKGVTVPADLEGPSKAMYDRMAKLNGAAFDKMYVADMLKDHKKDVAEFETMSKTTKDAELKGFIDKTLPTLKEHLTMIEKISKEMGGAAAKKK